MYDQYWAAAPVLAQLSKRGQRVHALPSNDERESRACRAKIRGRIALLCGHGRRPIVPLNPGRRCAANARLAVTPRPAGRRAQMPENPAERGPAVL